MEITQPALEKDVTDYDFILINGAKIPLTLDAELGDTFVEELERFVVSLTAKPSRLDPEVTLPAETAYVYKRNVATLVVRHRKQRLLSPEEIFDINQTIHKISGTLQ